MMKNSIILLFVIALFGCADTDNKDKTLHSYTDLYLERNPGSGFIYDSIPLDCKNNHIDTISFDCIDTDTMVYIPIDSIFYNCDYKYVRMNIEPSESSRMKVYCFTFYCLEEKTYKDSLHDAINSTNKKSAGLMCEELKDILNKIVKHLPDEN